MIGRIWRGVIRTVDTAEYVEYVRETGIDHYKSIPGNRGAWILTRSLGETTEILTFSLWDGMAAVKAFAGESSSRAVYYPEDDRYLVERGETVDHYEVG